MISQICTVKQQILCTEYLVFHIMCNADLCQSK